MPPVADAEVRDVDDLFRDEPYIIWFRIFSIERAKLSAPAAAGDTMLTVLPLTRPLSSGYRVFFSNPGFSVKLSGSAVVGATSLSVAALSGPIPNGSEGRRQLDAASLSLSWTLEKKQPQVISPVLLTKIPTTVSDPQDPDVAPFTLAQVAKTAAELATTDPGVYVQRLVRTDTSRCLAQGDVVLKVR